ncbi:MAG: DUF1080 domain-containing protein [Phycisphaeraceae bacterium]|nr:MAG: DUF1080 domain-containing protein [Phycisphaeraceae bacterium]
MKRAMLGVSAVWSACVVLSASTAGGCKADDRIPVLLVTGHNNHNWKYTSRYHKETLESTGRFRVDIADHPASVLRDPVVIANYKVFVLDYNDSHEPKRWGREAEENFEKAVREGAGVVSVHAANNAFHGWEGYERMIGLMWREGTGHGRFHDFSVEVTDAEHPITKGLPEASPTTDELYHRLVNSRNVPYRLLARAMSTTESGGTGAHEPMAFTLEYGKGRVFHTPLGHVWWNRDSDKVSVSTPVFKALLARGTEWAATGNVTIPATWTDAVDHNALTDEERDAGWQSLFDGKAAPKFKGFRQNGWPQKGWTFGGGVIRHEAGGGGGDIVTVDEFGDFEFKCQWRVAPGGNSGIFLRVSEDLDWTFMSGPEMQVLDNAGHNDGKVKETSAGALYGLYPAREDTWRPAGEWNHVLVRAKGPKLEFHLNGFLVVEADTSSDDWKQRIAASKFKDWPLYGKNAKGRIGLQDHGDLVEYRGLKVRSLK